MVDRYFITLGAPTTAGGKVTSGSRFRTIDGVALAVVGDTCWCAACLSEGVIVPDGPRLDETIDGRLAALHDDLCLCQCSPPPRLVAAQRLACQSVDADWYAGQLAAARDAAALANAAALRPDDSGLLPIVLLDPDTLLPLETGAYRLDLGAESLQDLLDGQGRTEPLAATQRAGAVTWLMDEAN
ncbi:PAAR domain-containing protein [Massilia sp. Leaf139]|uniref:PAAR domain-containing protein n=1 Tax=Massilia sp. Leaf139 TaxID=1736272 RepID=UPI0009E869C9|nr:PAAR domain-containing protein [Massilia sp. Leaf139]